MPQSLVELNVVRLEDRDGAHILLPFRSRFLIRTSVEGGHNKGQMNHRR
jgi:hypothetical protein